MSDNASNAESMFLEGYNCAQAVLACCGEPLGLPRQTALQVAQAFGGGMGRTADVCGAVTGAMMVIGMKHCVKDGKDLATKQESYRITRELLAAFQAANGSIRCRDLLGCDISTDEGFRRAHDGGLTRTICPRLVRSAAQIVTRLLAPQPAGEKSEVHKLVQDAYAEVARKQSGCCESKSSCCDKKPYTVPDHPVPESELGLSCGNPLAFGEIALGNVVLDLGSGAGKDVFLAAQKVGSGGKAIGVDMTPEMLALARKNAVKFFTTTGLNNVEFRHGHIEALPVEDASVDVVISNCVINLSPDKPQVFREVFRVLRSGGRMIVSDIVLNRELPASARNDADLYSACVAGALLRDQYLAAIRAAGFADVRLLSDKTYQPSQAACDPVTSGAADALAGIAASITVLAAK